MRAALGSFCAVSVCGVPVRRLAGSGSGCLRGQGVKASARGSKGAEGLTTHARGRAEARRACSLRVRPQNQRIGHQ